MGIINILIIYRIFIFEYLKFQWQIVNEIMWESIVELILAEDMWDSWDWTNWTNFIFISLSWLVGLHRSDPLVRSQLTWNKAGIVNIFTQFGFLGLQAGQGSEAAEIFGCNKQGFRLRESNTLDALK